MLKILKARWQQGHRTTAWPKSDAVLPDRFRGLPVLDSTKCRNGCERCVSACPTNAVKRDSAGLSLDLGKCLFCTECTTACPDGAIAFSRDHRLSTRRREDLVLRGQSLKLAEAMDRKIKRLFGRSLKLRQVSAGGCNACEADLNVLSTIGFDLGRFGIQFVASPRHADGVVVTGPVSENMRTALIKTYDATPAPKLVIAVGSCAISGGPFAGHGETHDGVTNLLPVDLFIPGCPPHPFTILDGLLRLIGRL